MEQTLNQGQYKLKCCSPRILHYLRDSANQSCSGYNFWWNRQCVISLTKGWVRPDDWGHACFVIVLWSLWSSLKMNTNVILCGVSDQIYYNFHWQQCGYINAPLSQSQPQTRILWIASRHSTLNSSLHLGWVGLDVERLCQAALLQKELNRPWTIAHKCYFSVLLIALYWKYFKMSNFYEHYNNNNKNKS